MTTTSQCDRQMADRDATLTCIRDAGHHGAHEMRDVIDQNPLTQHATYTGKVLAEASRIQRAHAQYRAEVAYVNAVLSAAERVSQDIREDDGVDPDLDEAITAVYSFTFDMAGALVKVEQLRTLLDCHLDTDQLAELNELKPKVER
jgi:hypothetical protein